MYVSSIYLHVPLTTLESCSPHVQPLPSQNLPKDGCTREELTAQGQCVEYITYIGQFEGFFHQLFFFFP